MSRPTEGREKETEREKWRAVRGPSVGGGGGVCGEVCVACRHCFHGADFKGARIMRRARGFRQREGKKITSKLAAHLNRDNPKTVALKACCTGSDVPPLAPPRLLLLLLVSASLFSPKFSFLCGSTATVTSSKWVLSAETFAPRKALLLEQRSAVKCAHYLRSFL